MKGHVAIARDFEFEGQPLLSHYLLYHIVIFDLSFVEIDAEIFPISRIPTKLWNVKKILNLKVNRYCRSIFIITLLWSLASTMWK